jgi:hypothetical protein
MRRPLVIYDFATDPFSLNFLIHEENLIFFFISDISKAPLLCETEPVFLNVYGAQESIPRNEFRQPM